MAEVQWLVLQEVRAVPEGPVGPQHRGPLRCQVLPCFLGDRYHRLVLSFLIKSNRLLHCQLYAKYLWMMIINNDYDKVVDHNDGEADNCNNDDNESGDKSNDNHDDDDDDDGDDNDDDNGYGNDNKRKHLSQVYPVVLVELAVRGVQEVQQIPYPLVPLNFLAVLEFLEVLKHL